MQFFFYLQMDKYETYLLLILVFLIWGSLYFVSKIVLLTVPPFTIIFFRYALSVLILIPIIKHKKLIKIQKCHYKYFLFIGILGYFGAIFFQLLGTKLLPSSTSALINSSNPITIPIFAFLILNQHLSFVQIIGIIFSMLGIYIIIGFQYSDSNILGCFYAILSVILWSIASVFIKKLSLYYKSIQISFIVMVIASVISMPFCFYELNKGTSVSLNKSACIGLIYMAIICTALAQTIWNKCISSIKITTCSSFYPLQIVFATIFGFLFLKEKISFPFIEGALLIIIGIFCSIIKPYTKRND